MTAEQTATGEHAKTNSASWRHPLGLPLWTVIFPLLGVVAVVLGLAKMGAVGTALAALFLAGSVMSAVHQAEVVAHRVGEPFGTLVLAVAVTVIEVSLIVSLMLSDSGDAASLARDTVFAAIMIILNLIIGLCLLLGGIRHHEQFFTLRGISAALAVLASMAVLVLVLPNFTTTIAGPSLSTGQLLTIGAASLILYAGFVAVQTVRHRDYFLPESDEGGADSHAAPPSMRTTWAAFGVLLIALVVVVLLAKALAPSVEEAVIGAGLPLAVVGVVIAALILAPECLAAVRAARRNRLQTSLNLAFGSALAMIGMTIPVVALVSIFMGLRLNLGIDPAALVLLVLSLFVTSLSLNTGRTTILQGIVHLTLFAVYLVLVVVP